MKKQHFFNKIILSISSKDFYKVILHEHLMKSFLFLVLFSLLVSMPYSIYSSINTIDKIVSITEDFPEFTLEDGVLTVPSNQPYIYEDKSKEIKIIMDTTGAYGLNDLAGFSSGYLLTSKSVIISQAGLEPQTIKYSDIYFSINKNDINTVNSFKTFIIVMAIAVSLFLTVLINLFKSLFTVSIVFFMKNIFLLPLNFSKSYKIAIYTMSAPILLVEIVKFIPIHDLSNYTFFVYLFINMIYIVQILLYLKNGRMDF